MNVWVNILMYNYQYSSFHVMSVRHKGVCLSQVLYYWDVS